MITCPGVNHKKTVTMNIGGHSNLTRGIVFSPMFDGLCGSNCPVVVAMN
jgi:hypothetical protein